MEHNKNYFPKPKTTPTRRPKICELFDTQTAREYTILNETIRNQFAINELNLSPVEIPKKIKHPKCYLCNQRIVKTHWFYHFICPTCGDVSYQKRNLSKDLTGYKALVTGGRVKLGYQIALKLLRCGSQVLITSRNWKNAIERYQDEPDYHVWKDRLHVCQIDFDLLKIDILLKDLDQELNRIWPDDQSIDILINNAAQTISGIKESSSLNNDKQEEVVFEGKKRSFPPLSWCKNILPKVDRYQRVIDQRETNSWTCKFGNVDPEEAKQVLLANAWAPFVLTQFMLPRLMKSNKNPYIINLHSKEGHFSSHKTTNHSHTNISKAGLQIFTRILAATTSRIEDRQKFQEKYISDLPWKNRFIRNWKTNIISNELNRSSTNEVNKYINVCGCDPGFLSVDEFSLKDRIEKNLLFPPIDEIDGAARVLYPIFINMSSFPSTIRHYIPLIEY